MLHAAQILIPYLAGLQGMYCLNAHLPLNGTKLSSTVMSGPGLYISVKCSPYRFQTLRIAASMSVSRREGLVVLSSNRMALDNVWNLFSNVTA